jgi:polysaccharide export outer membrane protein
MLFAAIGILGCMAGRMAVAQSPPPAADKSYLIQPGDTLQVTVWKEQDLTAEVIVRSDGGLSFPLVGDVQAAGKTVEALRDEFTKRLKSYIPDPVVTISTKQFGGNQIYVIGRVQRPGGYPFVKPLDVMEALSLAGGGTPFASMNRILILRRENGQQRVIRFHYNEVASGKDLAENILLQSGDTVVVP